MEVDMRKEEVSSLKGDHRWKKVHVHVVSGPEGEDRFKKTVSGIWKTFGRLFLVGKMAGIV